MDDNRKLSVHRFKILDSYADLVHAVFTRHGGVSQKPYDTLNVSWTNGDRPQAVQENIDYIKLQLGLKYLVSAPQVHGCDIRLVNKNCLKRATQKNSLWITEPADALVTQLDGVGLLMKIADCQAVFVVDPQNHIVANIHCGWRGSVKGIISRTIAFMRNQLGSTPKNLLATISPSLGPCCAEFVNYQSELPPDFWVFQHQPRRFDFWAISRKQLQDCGIRPENIEIAGLCTVCEKENFFSYRAEGTTGRFAAVIAWNSSRGKNLL